MRPITLGVLAVGLSGCGHFNNPFKDSGAVVNPEMTTASAEGFTSKAEFSSNYRRKWDLADVRYANGAVSHWPLWFEDPFEDKGNRYLSVADRDAPDNVFAWNGVDYLHVLYGPARMFLNIMGMEFSAVVEPPLMLMESNGRIDRGFLGYDHDAKRSNWFTREPPDMSRITYAEKDDTKDAGKETSESGK